MATVRTVLVSLVVLCFAGLFAYGGAAVFVGIAEQHAANHTYLAGFAHPGDDCGAAEVSFDVSDGEVLSCEPRGVSGVIGPDEADFPGFTDKQNQDVTDLARRLGSGGLSPADRRRIQDRVDRYAATVPASRRPHYDEGVRDYGPLWGAGLAWAGAGAVATPFVVLILTFVIASRRRGSS